MTAQPLLSSSPAMAGQSSRARSRAEAAGLVLAARGTTALESVSQGTGAATCHAHPSHATRFWWRTWLALPGGPSPAGRDLGAPGGLIRAAGQIGGRA